MKIDLTKYYDNKWRACLSQSFYKQFIEKLKAIGTKKRISSISQVSLNTVDGIYRGLYNPTFDVLFKMTNVLGISREEVLENIEYVYSATIGGEMKFLKEINIDSRFAEWYGAWIGDGDHSPNRECLSLTNYSIDVLNLHLYIIKETFAFNKDKIRVEITTNSNDFKDTRIKWSQLLDIDKSQISVYFSKIATRDTARVCIWCTSAFRIITEAKNEIRKSILSSEDEVKANYLRGIYAAEGSCRSTKGFDVRLTMKDNSELNFAKQVLEELGIKSTLKKDSWREYYTIIIFGWEDIMKFYNKIGFGKHEEKNRTLEKMIKRYKQKPIKERYRSIIELTKSLGKITSRDVIDSGIGYFYAHFLLRNLVNTGILHVDKSNKLFIYSLIKDKRDDGEKMRKELEEEIKKI